MSGNNQTEPKNRLTSPFMVKAARIGMMQRTAAFVGQAALAEALGIEPRSLRNKLSADRGVGDPDLRLAAAALEKRAAEMMAQARAITDHLTTAGQG